MNQLTQQIPIPDLYKQVNHITNHGIQGYQVKNKYFDPKQNKFGGEVSKLKLKQIKRGSYLQDQAKLHQAIPGPGKYKLQMAWPKKTKSLHKQSDRITYISELMRHQKKQKRLAPGHYKTFKSQKQIQAQKKALASKKINAVDRLTYLDHIQYQSSLTPGIGAYNPHVTFHFIQKRVKTEYSKIKTNPEQWRVKHEKQKKKKPPKAPDMGTYNPVPSDYDLFSMINKTKTGKNYLGKVQRFKTQPAGSNLPPNKYCILQQWRGKDVKKKDRHGLQSISKGMSKSVYYH